MKTLFALMVLASSAFGWTSVSHSCSAATGLTLSSTGADLIQVTFGWNGFDSPTVTDSVGGNSNSWTLAQSDLTHRMFYSVPAHVGASHAFTIGGYGGSASYWVICVSTWSGAKSTATLDSHNSSNFAGTPVTISAGSITAGYTDVLVF